MHITWIYVGPTTLLPPGRLNGFGIFDHKHRILWTPMDPKVYKFMLNTGTISLDCEMVGVGPYKESALARVSIVNEYGFCIYHKFVKPEEVVTDFRTWISGVRKRDLWNATPFHIVRQEVAAIIKNRILVGHSLENDFAVLKLAHPECRIRDTQNYFMKKHDTKWKPGLKSLTQKYLGVSIQEGKHCPITDARAAMALYLKFREEWEKSLTRL